MANRIEFRLHEQLSIASFTPNTLSTIKLVAYKQSKPPEFKYNSGWLFTTLKATALRFNYYFLRRQTSIQTNPLNNTSTAPT
jgi:hypothetical protein